MKQLSAIFLAVILLAVFTACTPEVPAEESSAPMETPAGRKSAAAATALTPRAIPAPAGSLRRASAIIWTKPVWP